MKTLPITLLCLFCGVLHAQQSLTTDLVVPPESRVEWVSTNLGHNGQSMSVRTFNSTAAVDDVLQFYRGQWQQDGEVPGYVENRVAAWSTISQLQESHNTVLQLQPDSNGGSTGFFSTLILNKPAVGFDNTLPAPGDTSHISTTRSVTGDLVSHTSILTSNGDLDSATDFYRNYFLSRGWSVAKDDRQRRSRVVLFDKYGDRCELVVSEADYGSTLILVNRVIRHD